MILTYILLFRLGVAAACVFIKYNGQWDGTSRYDGGEMERILVPLPQLMLVLS